MNESFLTPLQELITKARSKGCDQAEACLSQRKEFSLSQRLGRLDQLQRSELFDLGLRVFIGKKQAVVTTSDPQALEKQESLIERVLGMAREVPEDPYAGLANSEEFTRDFPELDLYSEDTPSIESLREHVQEGGRKRS